jgi:hypothetical protein
MFLLCLLTLAKPRVIVLANTEKLVVRCASSVLILLTFQAKAGWSDSQKLGFRILFPYENSNKILTFFYNFS